jgi:hypothetical protein
MALVKQREHQLMEVEVAPVREVVESIDWTW